MVKVGLRKPNLKTSLKARTTGRAKRAVKRAIIPGYGKKGMGWIKNPKKAAYNAVYSGGLKIYTTQDSDIQKICDKELSDSANYPYAIKYSINWAWSVQNPDGSVDNYSEKDILNYIIGLVKMNRELINYDLHIIVRDNGKESIAITDL